MERKENSLKSRVSLLESNQTYIIGKLDEIANKLKIPSYEAYAGFKGGEVKVEDKNYVKDISDAKIFYQSKPIEWQDADTWKDILCTVRMSETEYKKFCEDSTRVFISLYDYADDRYVFKDKDYYVMNYTDNDEGTRQIAIGYGYLKPSDFTKKEQPTSKDAKSDSWYESKHFTIYKVPDTNKEATCYLRMDEANYKKFRYGNDNYVKVDVVDAKTNEKVDWYNKAYVTDWSDGRQLSIGNTYFVPSNFVKVSKKKDGTKVFEKPKGERKYESTKTVVDYDGKHTLKVVMSEAAYNDFIYEVQNIVIDLVDAYTNEKLRTRQVHVLHNDLRKNLETRFDLYDETFTPDDFKLVGNKDSINESAENNIQSVTAKLRPMDIERLYKELDYDKWMKDVVLPHKEALKKYDDGSHLKELKENDPWDEDTEKSDNMYVKLANLIAWFDIDKIAHNIVKVNLHATNNERIDTVNIDGNSFESVRAGLYDNVKELITDYIGWDKSNSLDESNSLYDMQVGRVHFMAIFVKYDEEPDESYVKYKLYWTNDECEEGEL